jgi:hypothetical protein
MSLSTSLSLKTLTAAALALGGTVVLQPAPASAQVTTAPRVFYRGVPVGGVGVARPAFGVRPVARGFYGPGYGGGWRGGYYGPRYGGGWRGGYYGPRYGGGWRGGYYGPRYGWGYPYRYGYYRGYDGGGAVAAGLIGGLALGAIASAAANPYYYPSPYYRPAYYEPSRTCFTERRRIVNRYGRVVVRRVQTCY